MEIVIATNNKNKLKIFKDLFAGTPYNILSQGDAGFYGDIAETADTFYGNALIKAETVCEKTGKICLADDSGLEVFALNNAPGVYSARFAGESCNDKANNAKLLGVMSGITDREARYVCVLVIKFPDGRIISAEGVANGRILEKEKGTGGFGYDPLFFSYDYGMTFAEAHYPAVNAALVSHRTRAYENLLAQIK